MDNPLQSMPREQLEQLAAEVTRIQWQIEPIQVGNEIRVIIQISAPHPGLSMTFIATQETARLVSKAIKDGVERAEVTLVKPQSVLAQA